MSRKLALLIALWCILTILPFAREAKAHPHVYVDTSLVFVIDDSGLSAVHENWVFDEIFTSAILADLEITPDNLATTLGQEKIKQGAFTYLGNFDYFTFIENNGQRFPIPEAENFVASFRDGRLVYDFTIPVGIPLSAFSNFRFAVFDQEYYTDVLLVENGISFEIDTMAQVSHRVRPAKDQTYWQFIVPKAIHLSVAGAPSSEDKASMVHVETAEEDKPGLMERIMEMVRSTQKQLTLKLNGFGMDIKDNPFGPALWMFLGFSLLYGIVHAVGPGHGKAVVCSYFLANPGSFATGALMGNCITFVHMASAAVVVGMAYLLFSSGMGGFAAASRALQPASYALLALLGLVLLVKALRDVFRGGLIAEPSCPAGSPSADQPNTRRVLMVSFVTGLIPCPGAAVILAFAIGQDIFWAGMAAIVAMAVGMGLTTTLFAWGAVMARTVTLKMSGANTRLFNWVYAGLSICGAAAITLFGAALFMSSPFWH